jgi:hypothetical protein
VLAVVVWSRGIGSVHFLKAVVRLQSNREELRSAGTTSCLEACRVLRTDEAISINCGGEC